MCYVVRILVRGYLSSTSLRLKLLKTIWGVAVNHRAYEELIKSFLEGGELAKAGWMRVEGGWFVLRGGWGLGREVVRDWDGLDGRKE